jgi:biotin operon repressor
MSSFRLLVLAFVTEYLGKHSASPSYGEIAAALESSRERVHKAVRSLERDGLLVRTPGPRGLSLPTLRDAAIRQLRAYGFVVDEDMMEAHRPVTDPPLLPPIELDYPAADGNRDKAA